MIEKLENKARNTLFVLISCLISKTTFKPLYFKCRFWQVSIPFSVHTTVLCRWCFWHCSLFQYQGGTCCSYSRVWGMQWKEILACKKQVKYTTTSACVHYSCWYTLKEVMLMWLKICYFSRINEHLKYAEILLGVGQEFLYSLEHCSFWRTNTYVVSSANVIHALGILHSPNTCAWGDITKQHSWLTHSS